MERTVIEPLPGLRTRFKMRIDKDGRSVERAIFRFHLFNTAGESATFDWLVDETGDAAAPVALILDHAAVQRNDAACNEEKLFFIEKGMNAGGLQYADLWLHESLLPRRLLEETPIMQGTTVARIKRRYQLSGMDVWFHTLTDPQRAPRILDNAELNETLIDACSKVAELSPKDKNDAWL